MGRLTKLSIAGKGTFKLETHYTGFPHALKIWSGYVGLDPHNTKGHGLKVVKGSSNYGTTTNYPGHNSKVLARYKKGPGWLQHYHYVDTGNGRYGQLEFGKTRDLSNHYDAGAFRTTAVHGNSIVFNNWHHIKTFNGGFTAYIHVIADNRTFKVVMSFSFFMGYFGEKEGGYGNQALSLYNYLISKKGQYVNISVY